MTDDPRTDEIVITIPTDLDAGTVGVVPRPPRAITLGRRRSDRWMVWSIVALVALQALFTIYVAVRVDDIARAVEAFHQ